MLVEFEKMPEVNSLVDIPWEEKPTVHRVISQLRKACEDEHGIGVSAVQIGVPWRLFVIKGNGDCPFIQADEYVYLCDCDYRPVSEDKVLTIEGCLSIRDSDDNIRSFKVERYDRVIVEGYKINPVDLSKEKICWDLMHTEQGIVFQHEIDHHKGITIDQIGEEMFVW